MFSPRSVSSVTSSFDVDDEAAAWLSIVGVGDAEEENNDWMLRCAISMQLDVE